jgi:hypothetical protein
MLASVFLNFNFPPLQRWEADVGKLQFIYRSTRTCNLGSFAARLRAVRSGEALIFGADARPSGCCETSAGGSRVAPQLSLGESI